MLSRSGRKSAPQSDTEPAAEPIAAEAVYQHLLLAPDGLWAWFRAETVPWAYRSSSERASILDAATIRWSDLAGHRVHIRRTSHPVPYSVWARNLDHATPNPLTVPEGAPTWADYLRGAQTRIAQSRMENPTTYIGVRLTTQRIKHTELPRIFSDSDVSDARIVRARSALTRITTIMGKDGFAAKPVTSRLLGWLIHASTGIGVPVSVASLAGSKDEWQPGDMETFTAPVVVTSTPLGRTVTVTAVRDGVQHTRHVAVLSVGRMNDRLDTDSPAFEPWLAATDRLPFPVEWSAVFDVIAPESSAGSAAFFRRRAESILEHYQEHGETPPPAVSRGIHDAVRIEDEIADGDKEVAVRVAGPIRCAIAATTETETLERVATLVDQFAMHQRIALHHTWGQYGMYREFTPGELPSSAGFQRVMPAYYVATAVPNAGNEVGDGNGLYLGRSGHRAVMWDPTWGPRHNKSGMVLVAGGLGSGKSTLGGGIAEMSARRGHQTVIFDPSGPLARLCQMPALTGSSRHVELSGADPGTLNPYWLIPEPVRAHYQSDTEWNAATREADVERRDLMVDALSMLLPEKQPGVVRALEHAVNNVGGAYAANPWRVVHALEDGDALSQQVGEQLRDIATMKGARLIFPDDEDAAHVDARALGDNVLTVITMRGIVTPPVGTPRADWTRGERMAVPVLHLAARYAMRAMYANDHPKTILADETGIVATGASTFRSFLTRGARDSRKSNTCFAILSQNPADLLSLAPQIGNLIGSAFMGRIGDEESAAAALPLLGVPAGHGYEKALTRLETGQFLLRDWHGRVDRIDVDLAWRPDLLATLNTTPQQQVRTDTVEGSWTDELVTA